jgi:hypothetical protein
MAGLATAARDGPSSRLCGVGKERRGMPARTNDEPAQAID